MTSFAILNFVFLNILRLFRRLNTFLFAPCGSVYHKKLIWVTILGFIFINSFTYDFATLKFLSLTVIILKDKIFIMANNIILSFFFFWLFTLTLVVLKLKSHYYNLISRTKKTSIDEILDQILFNDEQFKKEIESLKSQLNQQINQGKFHLQKIGLVRFDPFERMAGEQSFVLALLDNEDNGIVLNFISTKEGLRVYTKRIKNRQAVDMELSQEEKEAIKNASLFHK